MTHRRTSTGTYFKPGSNNVWCQRCGKKIKADLIKVEWDGLKVCSPCYEERHPQDMVRGIFDHQAATLVSPEVADKFILPVDITGLTIAPFGDNFEGSWDNRRSLKVQLTGGSLPTVTELEVLNGANLVAVQSPFDGWEVLQYQVASLTAPNTYSLTRLLRARYGTELAMATPSGSPFAYLGQAGPNNDRIMKTFMGVASKPISPVNVSASVTSGDVTISWVRRSRLPALQSFDWDAPLDSNDERYELDVLTQPGGAVVRTLSVVGRSTVTYTADMILADWGAPQASLAVRVYQTDQIFGRGTYREATLGALI